ncbi:hypothetical protein HDU96_010763 [Phlyctochytrium bullatum]|nr:hypothetical protein HDU96_010763 [Phlyctochytrium bullatum]
MGSTGSRLLTGNSSAALLLESRLAQFHNGESALLFNSGYDANLGLFGCVPPAGSSVVHDELVHASVHDGIRRCRAAKVRAFRHNDVGDLARVVREEVERIEAADGAATATATATAGVIVAVESVYSMDGDEAPLRRMVELCESFGVRAGGVRIVVDEAHSTGVRGPRGRGLTAELGLEERVFARLHTFGKAVGAHGAVLIGPKVLRSYLVNYARPLIYSTSLPLHSLVAIDCAYDVMEEEAEELQSKLAVLIHRFQDAMAKAKLPPDVYALASSTPIQGIVIPGKLPSPTFSPSPPPPN